MNAGLNNISFTAYYGNHGQSFMPKINSNLPPELNARKIQLGLDKSGREWSIPGLVKNFIGELQEFKDAVAGKNKAEIYDELGDVYFNHVEVSRRLTAEQKKKLVPKIEFNSDELEVLRKTNPRRALQDTNIKISSRFKYVEEKAKDALDFKLNFEKYWAEAKALQKKLGRFDIFV